MVPNRLSYSEMWRETYPSRWTNSWKAYQDNKGYLMSYIKTTMERNILYDISAHMADRTGKDFFSGTDLYSTIKNSMTV